MASCVKQLYILPCEFVNRSSRMVWISSGWRTVLRTRAEEEKQLPYFSSSGLTATTLLQLYMWFNLLPPPPHFSDNSCFGASSCLHLFQLGGKAARGSAVWRSAALQHWVQKEVEQPECFGPRGDRICNCSSTSAASETGSLTHQRLGK